MTSRIAAAFAAVLGFTAVATAQDTEVFERVGLRITAVRPDGRVIVDRGRRDGVELGDVVLLMPPAGDLVRGTIDQVGRSSAVVQLQAGLPAPDPGVRGEVLVPRSRRPERPPTAPDAAPPDPAAGGTAPATPEPSAGAEPRPDGLPEPRWTNPDSGWRTGDPLLSRIDPVLPADRASLLSGRAWLLGNYARSVGDGDNDSFFRAGADGVWRNPIGFGGSFAFDGEINWKTEINDVRGTDLLVRRASYAIGGNRYEPDRIEFGRFLQSGMPEFGILDGVEYGRRLESGDRVGASFGLLPEPDDDFDTGDDLAVSAHYLFVVGDREELTFGGGFQKTFHNGRRDRDLLVGKVRYQPLDGWDLFATVWVDVYLDDRDQAKDRDIDITQAFLSTGRRFADGTRLDFTYRRFTFADILREGEFLPLLPDEIGDKFYDRIAARVSTPFGTANRLFGELAGWVDEDDAGVAAELGADFGQVWRDDDQVTLTGFANVGEFSTVLAGRAGYGVLAESGRWDAFYELLWNRDDDFSTDRDDLFQHRIAGSWSYVTADGWTVSLDAGLIVWDDEPNWNLGCFVQRAF